MTVSALHRHQIVTKVSRSADGRSRGGVPFTRGSLSYLLANRVYIGEMRHLDRHYPGEHDAIIPRSLWDRVEARLAEGRVDRRSPHNLRHGNMLSGLLFDGLGRPMRTCSAAKGSKTYHYYATCERTAALSKQPVWRLPARDLEMRVIEGIRAFLGDAGQVHDAAACVRFDHSKITNVLALAASRALDLDQAGCRDLIARVDVHDDRIDIQIAIARLQAVVDSDGAADPTYTLSLPTVRLRRGKELRLLLPASDGGLQASPDPALIKLLANAFAARDAVEAASSDRTLGSIATANGYSLEYFNLLLRLSMLAPDIVAAIHDGRQPATLNRQRLARTTNLPIEWPAQRTALGFA